MSAAQGFVWIHRNNVTPVLQQVAGHSLDVAGASHREPGGQHEDDTRTEPLTDLEQDELQKPTIQALSVLSNVSPELCTGNTKHIHNIQFSACVCVHTYGIYMYPYICVLRLLQY